MELVEVQYDFHDFTRRNVEHLNYLLFNLKKVKREKRWKGEEMRKRENKQKLIEKKRLERSKAR